jgi:hypothetical protein
MVRHRRCDGHYAGVECADAELQRHLVLSCDIGQVKEALVLSVAGVTAIMLIESLVLLILY